MRQHFYLALTWHKLIIYIMLNRSWSESCVELSHSLSHQVVAPGYLSLPKMRSACIKCGRSII